MKALTLALALAVGAIFATAQNPTTESARETENKLIALESAWNLAQKNHDSKGLNELLAANFVDTESDGSVMNKTQYLADANSSSVQIATVANENVQVFLYHDVAIVTGDYHTRGTNKGKLFDHRGRFTDTWIQQNGKWQCVASHSSLAQKS